MGNNRLLQRLESSDACALNNTGLLITNAQHHYYCIVNRYNTCGALSCPHVRIVISCAVLPFDSHTCIESKMVDFSYTTHGKNDLSKYSTKYIPIAFTGDLRETRCDGRRSKTWPCLCLKAVLSMSCIRNIGRISPIRTSPYTQTFYPIV